MFSLHKTRLGALIALGLTGFALSQATAQEAAMPQPINEQKFVSIGGIEQWITIRGDDRSNPVVLFLHGGPGNALSPYANALFAGWEKQFTLVQWDQRGAGRTYTKNGEGIEPTMTMERMVEDGIEVAAYLAKHLDHKKIILVGTSWGSYLGIPMAQARPDLFATYIGVGQLVGWRKNEAASYARVLELARGANDQEAVAALTAIGPPPWDNLRKWPIFRKWKLHFQTIKTSAPPAPDIIDPAYGSAEERAQYEAADDFSFLHFLGMTMKGPLTVVDLTSRTEFAIPVFFIQGEEDLTAMLATAKVYFDSIVAPHKQFYMIAGAGHAPSVPALARLRKVLIGQKDAQ